MLSRAASDRRLLLARANMERCSSLIGAKPTEVFGLMKSFFCLTLLVSGLSLFAAEKKIVFIAGGPSHGPGQHEHRAGCLLLQSCLDKIAGISSVVYSNGWPQEANALEGAESIVLYSDGGSGHPALQQDRLQQLDRLMKKGVGLACIH